MKFRNETELNGLGQWPAVMLKAKERGKREIGV